MIGDEPPRSGKTPMWKALLLAFMTAGWIVPLIAAASEGHEWLDHDLLYRMIGQVPRDSFPHLQLATHLFHLAVVWLGLVIVGWTLHYVRRHHRDVR